MWAVATGLLATAVAHAQPAAPAAPAPPAPPASVAPAAPDTAGALARERADQLPWARIEQVRRGNRVAEINVSSGAGDHRYTIVNREGRPPLSTQELSSGLSTPSFFRIEF